MTELNFQELAKQGNPQAIASFLESQLQSVGIAIAVNRNGDCLNVMIESEQVPPQDKFVEFVRSELANLQPDSINKVKVEGREIGRMVADWSQDFSLDARTYSEEILTEKSVLNNPLVRMENNQQLAINMEKKQPELTGLEHRLRSTFIVVGMVTGILAIAVVTFVSKTFSEPGAQLERNFENTASFTTAPDTFREAVNSALRAAELGRSAKTKEDWALVADRWQEAVSLMRRVPVSSPNHQVAQTKVVEYQKYLIYAQESAVNPPPPSPSSETTAPEKAEKANSKKSNSEKDNSEKPTSKKSNSEKENSEKPNSKKSNSEKEATEESTSKKSNSEK